MPRARSAVVASNRKPSRVTKKNNGGDLGFEATLWSAVGAFEEQRFAAGLAERVREAVAEVELGATSATLPKSRYAYVTAETRRCGVAAIASAYVAVSDSSRSTAMIAAAGVLFRHVLQVTLR